MDRRSFLKGLFGTAMAPVVAQLALPEVITWEVIEVQVKPAVAHIDGATEQLSIYQQAIMDILQEEDRRCLEALEKVAQYG